MEVDEIKKGTVLDHIDAGKGFLVFKLLSLKDKKSVLLANVPSSKKGRKDIIKIYDSFLSKSDLNKVSLISSATVNIVDDSKVIEKYAVSLPYSIKSFLKCPNPKCISNFENIEAIFYKEVFDKIYYRCFFCERLFFVDDLLNGV